jgi:hypothetical protein
MIERRIPPSGDPFTSAPAHDDAVEAHYACLERPCACVGGWVYLGIEEDGVERTEAVRCRRCNA